MVGQLKVGVSGGPNRSCMPFVSNQVFESLATPVERTDLWRYLVLCAYGGVYADRYEGAGGLNGYTMAKAASDP